MLAVQLIVISKPMADRETFNLISSLIANCDYPVVPEWVENYTTSVIPNNHINDIPKIQYHSSMLLVAEDNPFVRNNCTLFFIEEELGLTAAVTLLTQWKLAIENLGEAIQIDALVKEIHADKHEHIHESVVYCSSGVGYEFLQLSSRIPVHAFHGMDFNPRKVSVVE